MIPVCALGVIGYLDVAWLSYGYYSDQRSKILPLEYAFAAVAVAAAVLVTLQWRTGLVLRVWSPRRRLLGVLGAGLVALLLLALASRPLWMVQHDANQASSTAGFIAAIQKGLGLTVDGTRTYNEQTVSWQAWYLGWPTLALALVGYVLLVHRLIARRDARLLAVVSMGLSLSLLYFYTAQIVPDQVWAMRRYVPVVMPVLLLAAAVCLHRLWTASRWLRPLAAIGAVLVVAVPVAISFPLQSFRADVPQLRLVQQLCDLVPDDGAVLSTDTATYEGLSQVIRSYCGVPAAGVDQATPASLARIRAAAVAHGRTLYALTEDPTTIGLPAQGVNATLGMTGYRLPNLVGSIPQHRNRYYIFLWVGTVNADGSVRFITPH
jgi:hypothetical protein